MNKRLHLYVPTMLALLFAVAAAQAPTEAEAPPYLTEEVTFAHQDVTLAGTLTLPEGAGPHPAIVLIHGSGPNTRDQDVLGFRMFEVLADHLAREGIASLRYDKRGVGESTGEYHTATSADFADDAEAGLRYLLERQEIEPQNIGLLGHSEGGMIAPMIAARNPDVAFVISMAGQAVSGAELLPVQTERSLRAEGVPEEVIVQALEELQLAIDLNIARDWEALEALTRERALRDLQALPEDQLEAMGGLEAAAEIVTAQAMPTFQTWMHFYLTHDPAEDWQRVMVPVLALFGGLDTQVDVDQNRPVLEAVLERAPSDNVTVVVIEEANHFFQIAETGAEQPGELAPEFMPGFLETVADWLLARASSASP